MQSSSPISKELFFIFQNQQSMSKKDDDQKHRIAIVNTEKCKPKKCKQECKKTCPVNKTQKICIEVLPSYKIVEISELLCVGCGLCVKKCPFGAIKIINIPQNMQKSTTHRYGKNAFKLHRLPTPRPGQVLGLVGINGIGKSTALQILGNKLKPNLGRFQDPPEWKEVLNHFKGNELFNYLKRMLEMDLIPVIKPQYVDSIPKKISGKVGEYIKKRDTLKKSQQLKVALDMEKLYDRDISKLSGGQLQRFAMLITMIQKAQIYMFDQPTSYLDVKQRIKMARLIRSIQTHDNYIIVVQHDLSMLDYLSDFICVLYGEPTGYGVVTMPFGVREGINVFLAGFVPTQNMRFREDQLNFKISDNFDDIKQADKVGSYKYPYMVKQFGKGGFKLEVMEGSFKSSQITVLLGENGTGKTTFIEMLAKAGKKKLNNKKADKEDEDDQQYDLPQMNISYKPQKIAPKFEGTVEELLHEKVGSAWQTPNFASEVTKPLNLASLINNEVQKLSGGQLQRVAIILALAKGADTYLIDEPSAYLDSEQRIICAKMLKRFVLNNHKSAFVVEHDFIMATYLANQVIVYEGQPGVHCIANSPQQVIDGMNKFLASLGVTFRRDPYNYRPRVNKLNSVLDSDQKAKGNYFCLDD